MEQLRFFAEAGQRTRLPKELLEYLNPLNPMTARVNLTFRVVI